MKRKLLAWMLPACLVIMGCHRGGTGALSADTSASSPDLSTPKAAALSFGHAVETGDAALVEATTITDPASKQLLETSLPLRAALKKLNDAAVAKFGPDGKNVSGFAQSDADLAKQIEEADLKVTGDTATLTNKKGGPPLLLRKVSGQWKVDIASALKGRAPTPQASALAASTSKTVAQAIDAVTEEVKAGKYKTADQAKMALQQRIAAATLGSMGGPLGGQPGAEPGGQAGGQPGGQQPGGDEGIH